MLEFEEKTIKSKLIDLKQLNEEIKRLRGLDFMDQLENLDDVISNLSM